MDPLHLHYRQRGRRILVVDDRGRPIPGENGSDVDEEQAQRNREADAYLQQRSRKRQRLRREINDDNDEAQEAEEEEEEKGDDSLRVRVPVLSMNGVHAQHQHQHQQAPLDGPVFRGPPDYEWMQRDPRPEEEEEEEGGAWCFLCQYGQQAHELERNPFYKHLRAYIDDNFGEVDGQLLCTLVQRFYNEKLRPLLPREKARDWHIQTIHEHITTHQYSEYISLRKDLRDVGQMMGCLLGSGVYMQVPNDTGGSRSALKADGVLLWVKLLEKKLSVQNALRRIGTTKSSRTKIY